VEKADQFGDCISVVKMGCSNQQVVVYYEGALYANTLFDVSSEKSKFKRWTMVHAHSSMATVRTYTDLPLQWLQR